MVLDVAVTRVGVAAFVVDERVTAPPPPTTTNAMTTPVIVCRLAKAGGLRRTVDPFLQCEVGFLARRKGLTSG